MLIDTHCHLNMHPLSLDLDGVLARSSAKGVDRIIVPAYDSESWPQIISLANAEKPGQPVIFPALGIHPWAAGEISDISDFRKSLEAALVAAPEVVAIGEIGLDTKVPASTHQPAPTLGFQLSVLEVQLEMAVALDIPVILHCRGAFEELLTALKPFSGQIKGVLHAYSRGTELARRFMDAGLHIAFGGAVTRDRALNARQAAADLPLEKILLETDAPSIGLDGVLPQSTEPCHVWDIAQSLAAIRDESPDTIAEVTTRNAQQLFRI
jgi:TatD DNase family protein